MAGTLGGQGGAVGALSGSISHSLVTGTWSCMVDVSEGEGATKGTGREGTEERRDDQGASGGRAWAPKGLRFGSWELGLGRPPWKESRLAVKIVGWRGLVQPWGSSEPGKASFSRQDCSIGREETKDGGRVGLRVQVRAAEGRCVDPCGRHNRSHNRPV